MYQVPLHEIPKGSPHAKPRLPFWEHYKEKTPRKCWLQPQVVVENLLKFFYS